MSTGDTGEKSLNRKELFARRQAEYKEKAKERAKAARKAYMARPDVKEKLRLQKEKIAERRKEHSKRLKAAQKSEKSALSDAKMEARARKQEARDRELVEMLAPAADLDRAPSAPHPKKPTFTVIRGGRNGE
jgi:hypothetical protein